MTTWAGEPRPYPDDEGVRVRLLAGPVEAPERDASAGRKRVRRHGVPGCPDCTEDEPCQAHAVCDPLATIGAAPAAPVGPDERVRDWRPA